MKQHHGNFPCYLQNMQIYLILLFYLNNKVSRINKKTLNSSIRFAQTTIPLKDFITTISAHSNQTTHFSDFNIHFSNFDIVILTIMG